MTLMVFRHCGDFLSQSVLVIKGFLYWLSRSSACDHCDSPFIDPFIQKIQRQRTGALRYHFYNIVNSLINISVVLAFNFSFACLAMYDS